MSWARWSNDSDVYIFEHVGGYVQCCGCCLKIDRQMPVTLSIDLYDVADVEAHLQAHVAAGDKVPSYCWEAYHEWIEVDAERRDEARRLGILW